MDAHSVLLYPLRKTVLINFNYVIHHFLFLSFTTTYIVPYIHIYTCFAENDVTYLYENFSLILKNVL